MREFSSTYLKSIDNLEIKLKRKGVTQKQLAAMLNVSETTVSGWFLLRHAIPLDKVYSISNSLQLTDNEFNEIFGN